MTNGETKNGAGAKALALLFCLVCGERKLSVTMCHAVDFAMSVVSCNVSVIGCEVHNRERVIMARRPQSSIEGNFVTLSFTRDECVALMDALRAIESPSDTDAMAFRTLWASNAWA